MVGLGLALHGGDRVVEARAGVTDAIPGLGIGGDNAGGDTGLLGIDGAHGGDLGDRGVDTLGDEVGVGEGGRRKVGVEIGDDGAIDSLGKKLERVGRGLGGGRIGHEVGSDVC